jgi:UDP-3-O-[3-hydroxymyristoyl] glucosamine N-acyltransferase
MGPACPIGRTCPIEAIGPIGPACPIGRTCAIEAIGRIDAIGPIGAGQRRSLAASAARRRE